MSDNQCSERSEDWARFILALIGINTGRRRNSNMAINYFLVVGHTGKNILVEEWRRMMGKCDG